LGKFSLFEREEWTLFRDLQGLSQKAGVPLNRLRRLVLKELADNALDAAVNCECEFTALPDGSYTIRDEGPGIEGGADAIARLFSIRRPLLSSKLLRLPTRGTLGNGLRVVVGAVIASEGSMAVTTRGERHRLTFYDDGHTRVQTETSDLDSGTLIEIRLGDAIPADDSELFWAQLALGYRGTERRYKGGSSAYWYDPSTFFELTQEASDYSVRGLLELFDGCSGKRVNEIVGELRDRSASSLTRTEAADLLMRTRAATKPVNPERLGYVGRRGCDGYKRVAEIFQFNANAEPEAEVPYVFEAWAFAATTSDSLCVLVNGTPVAADMIAYRKGAAAEVLLYGSGLRVGAKLGRRHVTITINITTPFMPLLSDGKAPNLDEFEDAIKEVAEKAAKALARQNPVKKGKKITIIGTVEDNLDKAIEAASGGGRHRYSLRQLYYQLRPILLALGFPEPNYSTISKYITQIEGDLGEDLDGIYRDNRGTLYHPHLGEEIPLGTLNVEKYRRPEWTFNKILYCEKEGFFRILQDVKWPERNDCALLTSKGFATRAARDVLDLLGETDEEIIFFCIHDADASGTMIYQSLQKATAARPERKVQVINLGLEPEEALEMGLQVEPVTRKDDKSSSVADYVPSKWRDWLQTSRVELNAMSSPAFLAWLDRKMAPYDNGKIIPPKDVLVNFAKEDRRKKIRAKLTEEILREAGLEDQVEQALEEQGNPIAEQLEDMVIQHAEDSRADLWVVPIERQSDQLLNGGGRG
jgi:hypothetical protein